MLNAEDTPKVGDSKKVQEVFEDNDEEDTIRENQNWEDISEDIDEP